MGSSRDRLLIPTGGPEGPFGLFQGGETAIFLLLPSASGSKLGVSAVVPNLLEVNPVEASTPLRYDFDYSSEKKPFKTET